MTDFASMAAGYIRIWNEDDDAVRLELITEAFAPDATYTDPMAVAATPDELNMLVGAARAQFPGMRFDLLGQVDGHHDQARFQWALGSAGSDPIVVGFDVIQVDHEGRIANVLGFLDQVPSA